MSEAHRPSPSGESGPDDTTAAVPPAGGPWPGQASPGHQQPLPHDTSGWPTSGGTSEWPTPAQAPWQSGGGGWPPPGGGGGWPPPGGGGGGGWPPGGGDQQGWYPPGYWQQPQPPRRRHTLRNVLISTVVVVVLLCAGAVGLGVFAYRGLSGSIDSSRNQPGSQQAPAAPLDLNAVAQKVNPSVVHVNTVIGFDGARGAGTGIVLGSSGDILTNNHVVNGATRISVTSVANGRAYPASVVGYNRTEDIAVIRLDGASGLPVASLGNSDKVRVGDGVAAIGNAGGAGGTPSVAGGAVTALNQSIVASDASNGSSEELTDLIEVNANVQPGDSGGPLANSSGQVIGVNTAASAGFQFQDGSGQGYAIPINKAASIAKQIQDGKASATVHIGKSAFLGVQINARGGQTKGAPVAGTIANSPAEKAGLAAGDVITSVGDKTVESANALTNVMDTYHPGDKVKVTWTDQAGQQQSATVQLVEGPAG